MDATDVARSILGGFLADGARVESEVLAVETWLDTNAARVGRHRVAWAASQSIERAYAALGEGSPAGPPDDILRLFHRLPLSTQVTVALHEFAGLDDDAVAEATARPVAEVKAVLDGLEHLDEADLPPEPTVPAVPTESAVQPEREPEPAAADAPPAPPARAIPPPADPAAAEPVPIGARPARPRWWMIVAVVVLALIAGGIALSNLRDDTKRPAGPPSSGLGDAATIRREQLSAGCATNTADESVAAESRTIDVDGTTRSYRLTAAPPIAPGRPRPLLVDLGDLGQTTDEHVAETRFDALATALKLVVATAEPTTGYAQWNVNGDGDDPDDLALIDRIIDEQTRSLCIDQTRILVAGRGAGAHLAAAYACTRPGGLSGLIMVAGADHPEPCEVSGRLSVLAVLGADDPVYPASGGNGPAFDSTFGAELRDGGKYEPPAPRSALRDWAEALGCESTARQPISLVQADIDTTCTDGGEVWRVVIPGAGHEWYPITYDLLVQFLTTGPFAQG